ncbi:MAG: SDR family oxidoreductase [Verrucomicrobia bacterium]|nr:SDR family oxidoreductase [Verrucomicrobiota bacterium]
MTETAVSPVFIVTGASRGIGYAIVQELLRRGARVLGAARNPDTASAILVKASSGNCHYLQADITVETDRLRIIEKAKDLFGRIDGLINNAGHAVRTPASKTSIDDFRALLEINLLAAFRLAQAACEELRATRGTLVNISSVNKNLSRSRRRQSGYSGHCRDLISLNERPVWYLRAIGKASTGAYD